MVSQHALQQVSRGVWYPSMPCSRSPGGCGIPACLACFQAHTQGGSLGGSGQGGLQADTQGVCSGGSALRGECLLRGGLLPGGVSGDPPGMATAVGGMNPTFYLPIIMTMGT